MPFTKIKTENKYQITGILKGFQERCALIESEEGQIFNWPIKYLPENIKINDKVTLKLGSENTENNEKYQAMRDLLTELVN
jgi:hypothetical protein